MTRLFLVLGATLLGLVACGSETDADDDTTSSGGVRPGSSSSGGSSGTSGTTIPADVELPWEVISEQGETLLTNVYYADRSQNEQVMPHDIDVPRPRHAQIDRLIYPTLGNPNLYTKSDDTDTLVIVLRVEDAALAHLSPTLAEPVPGKERDRLSLTQDAQNRLQMYLVPRSGRDTYTTLATAIPGGGGERLVRIEPSEIQLDRITDDLPEALRARRTLRLMFRKDALAHVPAALYDLRFEILKGGRLATDGTRDPQVEWQYNAVRVFDDAVNEYSVVNVTDTQISMANTGTGKSRDHLQQFVSYINTSTEDMVKNAPFITFNGDLHNGGSALTVRQRSVANTYRDEATFIVTTLRELTKPIFLTVGNHDGYASTGVAPYVIVDADRQLGTTMDKVVNEMQPSPWPDFSVQDFTIYRNSVDATPGGRALDLYVGSFRRAAGARTYAEGWFEIPRRERNMVLYDGFHQWQRTYGALAYSFNFGQNHYVTMNSYDLRQHTRSGWGMYTVNYGGGLSAVQEEWLRRDVARHEDKDVVLLAHHDPRGGHNGIDRGYYFAQLMFHNLQQSMANYLMQEIWNPAVCKSLPRWAQPESTTPEECVHDGLQEWMAPDLRFDCEAASQVDGACAPDKIDAAHPYRFDAYRLVDFLATTPQLRTMLLGHTHMNTLEVLQQGQTMVRSDFSEDELRGFASLEVQNPARGYAWQSEIAGQTPPDYDPEATSQAQIEARTRQLVSLYQQAATTTTQKLAGASGRELVIMRTTTAADLSSQKNTSGGDAIGFTALSVRTLRDARGYALPQINAARYYLSTPNESREYRPLGDLAIPRTETTDQFSADNPLRDLFQL